MNDAVLEACNLTKRFGSLAAVDDLSLSVEQGEVFGLLGPNGAGKTTTIRMLCGLLKPDHGEVLIRGKAMRAGNRDVISRVGMCPQSIVIWKKLTCLEQLVFLGEMYDLPPGLAKRRASELLERLGLAGKSDALARELSGGMQRRLNLAAALIHDPEILVLDEPEAGLDPQSRVLVREFLREMAHTKTILLTTHNMDEAERVVTRVAIIDHGKLLCLDTPDALKRSVGDGDLLEVDVVKGVMGEAESAVRALLADVHSDGQRLQVRALDMVDHVSAVMNALQRAGVTTGDVRLRATTLEDVFLSLTGRSLRE